MKKTVFERIENLREMMERMENPEVVSEEVHNIFEMINKMEDRETKHKAMGEMMKMALEMVAQVEESPLARILNILGNKNTKVTPVNIKVNTYLDATLIEISKKIPYSKLIEILNKATKNNFEKTTQDLFSASYCKDDKHLHMEYIEERHNEIIIDMSQWNMSDEVAEVYIEGLVEYILK